MPKRPVYGLVSYEVGNDIWVYEPASGLAPLSVDPNTPDWESKARTLLLASLEINEPRGVFRTVNSVDVAVVVYDPTLTEENNLPPGGWNTQFRMTARKLPPALQTAIRLVSWSCRNTKA